MQNASLVTYLINADSKTLSLLPAVLRTLTYDCAIILSVTLQQMS